MEKRYRPPENLASLPFNSLRALYRGVLLHGTGRYARHYHQRDKSKSDNGVNDVLAKILQEGIQPQEDIVAKLLLPTTRTISLTRNRPYARCYAEMFGSDVKQTDQLSYRFGSKEDWWSYYIKTTARETVHAKNLLWLFTLFRNRWSRFSLRERFMRPSRLKTREEQRWLSNRAQITGNYPLIFGIPQEDIEPMTLPSGIRNFEVRTADPIEPAAIRFVEAPEIHIAETRQCINALGFRKLEVIPMEWGEAYSWEGGWEHAVKRND